MPPEQKKRIIFSLPGGEFQRRKGREILSSSLRHSFRRKKGTLPLFLPQSFGVYECMYTRKRSPTISLYKLTYRWIQVTALISKESSDRRADRWPGPCLHSCLLRCLQESLAVLCMMSNPQEGKTEVETAMHRCVCRSVSLRAEKENLSVLL